MAGPPQRARNRGPVPAAVEAQPGCPMRSLAGAGPAPGIRQYEERVPAEFLLTIGSKRQSAATRSGSLGNDLGGVVHASPASALSPTQPPDRHYCSRSRPTRSGTLTASPRRSPRYPAFVEAAVTAGLPGAPRCRPSERWLGQRPRACSSGEAAVSAPPRRPLLSRDSTSELPGPSAIKGCSGQFVGESHLGRGMTMRLQQR
jgi:hypothetical protein